jgi:hypothetical protein
VVILRKGSQKYGQPSVVGMLIPGRFKKKSRGTELLDELTGVLPAISKFSEGEYIDFVAAIAVINRYLVQLNGHIEESKFRSEFIRILNRMFVLYCRTSKPAACGVLVIVCHIESCYLTDNDAQLVRNMTNVHIEYATSLTKSISL